MSHRYIRLRLLTSKLVNYMNLELFPCFPTYKEYEIYIL